jgi:hypothetical protein
MWGLAAKAIGGFHLRILSVILVGAKPKVSGWPGLGSTGARRRVWLAGGRPDPISTPLNSSICFRLARSNDDGGSLLALLNLWLACQVLWTHVSAPAPLRALHLCSFFI